MARALANGWFSHWIVRKARRRGVDKSIVGSTEGHSEYATVFSEEALRTTISLATSSSDLGGEERGGGGKKTGTRYRKTTTPASR